MSDSIITIDEMRQNRNKCFYGRCLECKNADMLHVERSNCYIRCGCKTGKHFGTWSTGYPFVTQTEACPDFSKIVDEKHKRMVNLAWIISCERKMMCFRMNCPIYAKS